MKVMSPASSTPDVPPPLPRLLAFSTSKLAGQEDAEDILGALASLGPRIALVARHPDGGADGRALSGMTARFAALATPAGAAVIVAGRPDIAAAWGVAGIHLRAHDLAPASARAVHPGVRWVGRAVHSVAEAAVAAAQGADYLVFGNVFETATHPGRPARGLDELAAVVAVGPPVVAIGGITPERVEAVAGTGAWGVAAIGALWNVPDPRASAERLLAPWTAIAPGGKVP